MVKGKVNSFFTSGGGGGKQERPPCALCEGNHGIWSCRKFQGMDMRERWSVAKARRLCFHCLGSYHQGRACSRSKQCNINGCTKNHHTLLHDNHLQDSQPAKKEPDQEESSQQQSVLPREGATQKNVTNSRNNESEAVSLGTIPVWLKSNNRKVGVNVILDDASNESFLNEDVAGMLGIQEPFQTVKVHVLNNEIETFQSMPVSVTIESVEGEFSKSIDVKTCPRKVTGNYKAEDWRQSKEYLQHLKECDFPKPAEGRCVDLLIGVDNPELHYSRVDIYSWKGWWPNCSLGSTRMDLYWVTSS